MTDDSDDRRTETGQRSHKGPAFLSKLLRRGESDERRRERFRAQIEQTDE